MNSVRAALRRRWRSEMEWGRDHPLKFSLLMLATASVPDVIRLLLARRELRRLMAVCPENCCSNHKDEVDEEWAD